MNAGVVEFDCVTCFLSGSAIKSMITSFDTNEASADFYFEF